MTSETPTAVVQAWQEAVNDRNPDRVLQLSDPNIEIVGPRGSGYGHQLLRDWMGHARVHLDPLRTFAREDRVVVAQRGQWRSPETGELIGEADVASIFQVRDGRVVKYARHDSLEEALREAGLDAADERRAENR